MDWKLPEEHRFIPYRLPEVAEAIAAERPVFIVEGEKDADNLAKLGIVATCNAGGAKKWRVDHARHLVGADAIILPDNDSAGRAHVKEVWKTLRVAASRVRVLELPDLPDKGDVSDWLAAGGTAERLWQLVETDARDVTNVVPFMDREPAPETQRQKDKGAPDDDQPPHWAVEPWDEPVSGAELLDDIVRAINRYMVMPPHAAEAVALWLIHAWTIEAWIISPLLIIVSPTPGCGKTTLLSILFFLAPRSELISNTSASAIFRLIEQTKPATPTFLLDDGDSYFLPEESGVAGHRQQRLDEARRIGAAHRGRGQQPPAATLLDLGRQGDRHHQKGGRDAHGPRRDREVAAEGSRQEGWPVRDEGHCRACRAAAQGGALDSGQRGRPLGC